MSEDRDLTNAAAKAAGLWDVENDCLDIPWAPLGDDGDALELVRTLSMEVHFLPDAIRVRVPGGEWIGETVLPCDSDHLGKAQRRAIVRAAASLAAREAP